jgi:hypothetical protein
MQSGTENSVRKLINSVIPTVNYLLGRRRALQNAAPEAALYRVLQINALCCSFYDVARSQ